MKSIISRRSALSVLTASPLLSAAIISAEASSADSHLLALGRAFDVVAAKLDNGIAAGIDFDDVLLQQLDRLDTDIAATGASTIEGLCVKARAACWALLGDLDPIDNMTLDRSMALSIVRDLIRLHDPSLEHPGELKKLVSEIEAGASKAIATASSHF